MNTAAKIMRKIPNPPPLAGGAGGGTCVDADDGARGGVEREALEDILPVRSESEMVRFARRNVRKAAKTDRETD